MKQSSAEQKNGLDKSLVEGISKMLDDFNVLAKSFRRVRDFILQDEGSNMCLRLFRSRSRDARTYNLPTSDEVAVLIVGDLDGVDAGRDLL